MWGVQQKSLCMVFMQRWRSLKGQRRGQGVISASGVRTLVLDRALCSLLGTTLQSPVTDANMLEQPSNLNPGLADIPLLAVLHLLPASRSASPVAWQKSDVSAADVTQLRTSAAKGLAGMPMPRQAHQNLLTVRANPRLSRNT